MVRYAFTMRLKPGAYTRWGRALQHRFVLNDAGVPDLGELNEIFTLGRAARGE